MQESQIESAESALIERIRKGEKDLFYALIQPYERSVYLTAYAVLRNPADAEDAAQEALLKAFAHLDQLRSNEKFKGWLLLIALNEARQRRRRDRQHLYESLDAEPIETEDGDFTPQQFADWREVPSETLERKEIRASVRKALESLKLKYREVFVLRDMQHLSMADTAQVLGISAPLVKIHLHRARLQMREQLTPMFGKRWIERLPFFKGKKPW